MLRVLEGGCSVPVGVTSELVDEGSGKSLKLTGTVTSLDGSQHVQHTHTAQILSRQEAEEAGEKLARNLIEKGAGVILEDIGKDRERRIAESKKEEESAQVDKAVATSE